MDMTYRNTPFLRDYAVARGSAIAGKIGTNINDILSRPLQKLNDLLVKQRVGQQAICAPSRQLA
jgi:hypothetical protein